MSPAARISHSPPSNEEELGGTGLHSRSRNARAQARHRAKRKKYIETLEETVKRLQTIVDAAGLDPNAFPPPASPHPYALRELQEDNARLRRESDALRIQIAALTAHVSNGSHLYSSPASDAPTPPPERDPKKRKMSVERDHLYLAIPQVLLILVSSQDSHPGRTSPASASTSSLPSTVHTSNTSASSLVHSMLSPLQQQAVYNSIMSGFNSSATAAPSHASRPASPPPPVPVSTFAQLPSTSLLATSLYPLLTLGIAGGAVSGELGAAAWNAFQQSQLQAQQAQQNQSNVGQQQSGLGQQSSGLPSFQPQPHPLSFMSQSQPMSTLSSSLDSVSSLPRMDSGSSALSGSGLPRIDSPSGLPQSLESLRTSSPGAGPSSFSSPRFEPSSARFESSRSNLFEVTNAATSASNASTRFDLPSSSRFDSTTSVSRFDPVFDTSDSPHMLAGTPPGFSSSSSTPGFSAPGTRRSSSSSRRDDVP